MKTLIVFITMVMALVFGLGGNAEAKRLGGGKSVGQQSSGVTQRQNTPPAAAPNTPAVPPAAPVAPKRPWGAMLGGLAAGLGLAWLMSSLGLGDVMGNIMMFVLLAVAVMVGIGWFMRRKAASTMTAFQGAGAGAGTGVGAVTPASTGGSMIGSGLNSSFNSDSTSGLAGSQSWGVPAGFDTEGFLTAAKRNFVSLQAAWDKSDIPALRAMMTDSMLTEIKAQLAERESHGGSTPNHTEVVMLEARLLGIEENATEYLASVEFSGMIREDASVGANAFREVWNMSKPLNGGSGWLVAGIQALQ